MNLVEDNFNYIWTNPFLKGLLFLNMLPKLGPSRKVA